MAGNRKYSSDGKSSEDKALDLFAEMMIERIETISNDWSKPWFTQGAMSWPKNLAGREYNGMNALMLLMHCEKNGYAIPRFCTFEGVQRLNRPDGKQKDNEQPKVSVNKGEHSFPVMLTTFTCIHKDTKEKIKYDDYKALSEDEKKKYNVYPRMQVFRVFNVAQTNMQEARPELWNKLTQENSPTIAKEGGQMSFEPMDVMIRDNRWICPIRPQYQDGAYYSITKNEIVVPEKRQFKDGESYYGTIFHEMTHSTGAEGQLDRIKPASFGSKEYAREELVAELGSALVAQRYGMSKALKEESCAYLKAWLGELKESPQFIKTTLIDVKKATSMITQNVEKIARELDQGAERQQNEGKEKEKVFYSSVAYLQGSDETAELDELRNKDDYDSLLALAKEYYDGDGINAEYTFASPLQNRGDSLLVEDKDFAVVYNSSVGGTYEIMLKCSEQEVRDHLKRFGPRQVSDDIKGIVNDMVEKEFSDMAKRKTPAFEMPSGDVLYLAYNRNSDSLDAGTACNAGLAVRHSFPYDHAFSLDANIQSAYEKLGEMEDYKEKEVEYSGGMRR